jgi:hypothetical protein
LQQPASAYESVPEAGPRTVGAEELAGHTIPAERARGQAAAKVAEFIDSEMRAGRRHRPSDLSVLDLPSRGTDSSAIVAVMPEGSRVTGAFIGAPSAAGDGQRHGVGLAVEPSLDPKAPAATGGGPGYQAASAWPGLQQQYRECFSYYLSAENLPYVPMRHHEVYDCVEKFVDSSNSSAYAYNRYTLFQRAPHNSGLGDFRLEIIDATIRMRPSKGLESRVTGGPYNYGPLPLESCGSPFSFLVPFNSGASLTVPVTTCRNEIEPIVVSSRREIGTDWNGRRAGSVYVDNAFKISTANITPSYGYYVWLETISCTNIGIPCYVGSKEGSSFSHNGWW